MRLVYSSPRLENVDRVVELLKQNGIDTHIGNQRNYSGRSHQRFSYATQPDSSSWPQVWVVRSDDQPQARALLREAGIEPATRYAAELEIARARSSTKAPATLAARARLIVVVALGISVVIVILRALNFF